MRDAHKRAAMGKVSQELAEIVIVTDDNARGEDPAMIRCDLLAGACDALEVAEREKAIALALSILEDGDHAVLVGMGVDGWSALDGSVINDVACIRRRADWRLVSCHWPA